MFTRKRKQQVPDAAQLAEAAGDALFENESDGIECTIYGIARYEGSVVVFTATRVDNGRDVYITLEHRAAQGIAMSLDYEEPVIEVEPSQIIGYIPVPTQLTQLRNVR